MLFIVKKNSPLIEYMFGLLSGLLLLFVVLFVVFVWGDLQAVF